VCNTAGRWVCLWRGKKGLWEVRTNLARHRIARVIFCSHDEELVALNAFIKKTQKTPQGELDLAMDRKKEMER
jgi:phage-related protein